MNIKALNLDFYGTVVDWLWVWTKTCEKIKRENCLSLLAMELALQWREFQRDALTKNPSMPYEKSIEAGLADLCLRHTIKNNDYHLTLFNNWQRIAPFPEANGVLRKISKRIPMAICTNSSRRFFEACARKIPIAFDRVIISDETQFCKPHPRMYQRAVVALGVRKEEVLHVASSQMDVLGATRACLAVCWINRRREKRKRGIPVPDFEIRSLNGLLDILQLTP